MAERVYIYKRFERFWHWSQAGLIIFLMLTGFEVHGSYQLFGFEKAVNLHTIGAYCLIGLWVFAVFWHVTIGEWRQYIPTLEKVGAMITYYTVGIFTNAPHPFHRTAQRKHNPLQRITYLLILVLISPLIWITGLIYLFWGDLQAWGLHGVELRWIALGHTLGAYLMLSFLIAHLYLATTGHTVTSHIKAMVTGWDEA